MTVYKETWAIIIYIVLFKRLKHEPFISSLRIPHLKLFRFHFKYGLYITLLTVYFAVFRFHLIINLFNCHDFGWQTVSLQTYYHWQSLFRVFQPFQNAFPLTVVYCTVPGWPFNCSRELRSDIIIVWFNVAQPC